MTPAKARIQKERSELATYKLEEAGYDILLQSSDYQLCFMYLGNIIRFFPYKGWATGVGITDGRGIENLLEQIRESSSVG